VSDRAKLNGDFRRFSLLLPVYGGGGYTYVARCYVVGCVLCVVCVFHVCVSVEWTYPSLFSNVCSVGVRDIVCGSYVSGKSPYDRLVLFYGNVTSEMIIRVHRLEFYKYFVRESCDTHT